MSLADSIFSDSIRGRPFSEAMTKEEMFRLAKSWWDYHRETEHYNCSFGLILLDAPKRLLSVAGCIDHRSVRLAISTDSNYKKAPYACLSYCWGERQTLVLTRNTLETFVTDGVRLDDLPATIRDACELCDSLAIPYIFVDSLCVLQDSPRDWDEAASEMCDTYAAAALTIAAAASKDCRNGLLNSRHWASSQVVELQARGPGGCKGICYIRGRLQPELEPLESRGWAMQEGLLSPKLLTVGTAEMSWHCSCSVFRESEVAAAAAPVDLLGKATGWSRPLTIAMPPRESRISDLWRAFIWNYSRRRLSLEKDKLPAISGVASWLSRFTRDWQQYQQYSAGIWYSKLPVDLLWYHDIPFAAQGEHVEVQPPTMPRAPSWSWAAYDCPYLEWAVHTEGSAEHAKPLRCSEAELDLQGPIKRGWLVPDGTHPEQMDFWSDEYESDNTLHLPWALSNCLGRARLDLDDRSSIAGESFAEAVRRRSRVCECLRVTNAAGLLVEQVDQQTASQDIQQLRRLGLVQFKEDHRSAQWWADAESETVRLI